jgi:hypothetical protein
MFGTLCLAWRVTLQIPPVDIYQLVLLYARGKSNLTG